MVKEKADHQRLYDIDGFKKRAACVCVKNENENEVNLFLHIIRAIFIRIYAFLHLFQGPINIK